MQSAFQKQVLLEGADCCPPALKTLGVVRLRADWFLENRRWGSVNH